MEKRRKKVLLMGAKGYERIAQSLQVDCLLWSQISKLRNIRDYDVVILNLLSLQDTKAIDAVDWNAFSQLLDFHRTMDILMNGGMIIVLGDPRFKIGIKVMPVAAKKAQTFPHAFLEWTGVQFGWDSEPGDTIIFQDDYSHRRFADYISKLRKWTYSLSGCRPNYETLATYFSLDKIRETGGEIRLETDKFCCNRYKYALAFELYYQHRDVRQKAILKSWGPLLFLPAVNLSEDETLQLLLSTICGIETNLPEPEWLQDYVAPGQNAIDDEIRCIAAEVQNILDKQDRAGKTREDCRRSLKLLYEREFALEPVVREMLRGFGAHVEDPTEKNKEDGWLFVDVNGTKYEGVLEIKSTKSDTFSEEGRKQLLDWIDRGRTLRGKIYKGIFIGNSAVDKPLKERTWAFSSSWTKAAELSEICALKTEDLYLIHLLNARGLINIDIFWEKLFQTNGVFQMKEYRELLAPKDENTDIV